MQRCLLLPAKTCTKREGSQTSTLKPSFSKPCNMNPFFSDNLVLHCWSRPLTRKMQESQQKIASPKHTIQTQQAQMARQSHDAQALRQKQGYNLYYGHFSVPRGHSAFSAGLFLNKSHKKDPALQQHGLVRHPTYIVWTLPLCLEWFSTL